MLVKDAQEIALNVILVIHQYVQLVKEIEKEVVVIVH